ncbi:MAG: hypothetical protein ACC726_16510 [Chloroflexota bacterium]
MNQNILDSLFLVGGFSPANFPQLFYPFTVASLVLLVVAVVLYNVQTRRLHHHPPLVALQEWLFWTALAVFGLMLVYAVFKFYFIFVLITLVIGLSTFVWIRFFRFPPLIAVYNQVLHRERFLNEKKYYSPDSTIRARSSKKAKSKSKKRR